MASYAREMMITIIDTLYSFTIPASMRIDCGKGEMQMKQAYFYRCFDSDVLAVKPIIIEALQYIQDALPAIADNDMYELRLIFSELLFNAVIHGNQSDRNKNVRFSVDVRKENVCAMISDDGEGYDYAEWIETLAVPDELYSEHGRGIRLVKALADAIEFNPEGNAILFCKKVSLNG